MDREERRERREQEARVRRAEQVQVIINTAWAFFGSETPLGGAMIAQRLGWTDYREHPYRYEARLRDLMHDVRVEFVRQHPDYTITRPGDGLIRVTENLDDRQWNREVHSTARTINTKIERLVAQTHPWLKSNDPAQRAMATVAMVLAGIEAQIEETAQDISVTAA